MAESAVMSDEDAFAEAARLGAQLRQARLRRNMTTRQAAERMSINLGTLWRLETGRNAASLSTFLRMVVLLAHDVELDDGTSRPRVWIRERYRWPYPDQAPREELTDAQRLNEPFLKERMRNRVGAELHWLRVIALNLNQQQACALLGMSHHTLDAVEWAMDWPYLTSVIRVAALSGRRLELRGLEDPPLLPPWISAELGDDTDPQG